jgi:hypothetical protein
MDAIELRIPHFVRDDNSHQTASSSILFLLILLFIFLLILLFNGYGFGEVSGLVYVAASSDGDVISEELQGDDF